MLMRQTMLEFLDNPMGRGSNAITSRQLIVGDLQSRLTKLLETKKIQTTVWIEKKETFYIHLLIPTEAPERDNTYDVVLKFTVPEDKPDAVNDRNLHRYDVSVFSNSPSFTYTYAYAFKFYGMLVPELEGKFDKTVLNNAPITRNPGVVLNYEKTITFAMLYVRDNHMLDKIILREKHKQYTKNLFIPSVRVTSRVELEQRTAKQKSKSKKKEERDTQTKRQTVPRGTLPRSKRSATTQTSKTTKVSAQTKSVKRVTGTRSTRKSN